MKQACLEMKLNLSQLDKEKLLMWCEWLMFSLQNSLSMIKRTGSGSICAQLKAGIDLSE